MIPFSQEYVKRGKRNSKTECPLALWLIDNLNDSDYFKGYTDIKVYGSYFTAINPKGELVKNNIHSKIAEQVRLFDETGIMDLSDGCYIGGEADANNCYTR